jgi:hypothetical protein
MSAVLGSKLDLRKQFKHLYQPSPKAPVLVDVPALNFLMVDGAGDPNTADSFREAIGALYGLAYTLKFMIKKGPEAIDYPVMALEGLWWAEDMSAFGREAKGEYQWTVMIMQPEVVTADHFARAAADLRRKKNPPALDRVRLERFHEGLSAQILHVGPFAAEGPTIERLNDFIAAQGYERRGRHHEIYMSAFGRTAPERLKTVIRQPVG